MHALCIIVIKFGLAQWVDPVAGPVQVCQKIGQCNDLAKPGRPMTRARLDVFFSNVVFLLYPFFSYFFSWLLTFFKVHYINIRKVFLFLKICDLKLFFFANLDILTSLLKGEISLVQSSWLSLPTSALSRDQTCVLIFAEI